MQKLRIDVPSLYGDHHVTESRHLLFQLPGVTAVYASSCFGVIEIDYDPTLIDAAALKAALDDAGYTQPAGYPVEPESPAYLKRADAIFRHTAAYRQLGQSISFAQNVGDLSRMPRPPGFGVVKAAEVKGEGDG